MPSSLWRLVEGDPVALVPPSRAEPIDGSSRSIPARSSQMRTWDSSKQLRRELFLRVP